MRTKILTASSPLLTREYFAQALSDPVVGPILAEHGDEPYVDWYNRGGHSWGQRIRLTEVVRPRGQGESLLEELRDNAERMAKPIYSVGGRGSNGGGWVNIRRGVEAFVRDDLASLGLGALADSIWDEMRLASQWTTNERRDTTVANAGYLVQVRFPYSWDISPGNRYVRAVRKVVL